MSALKNKLFIVNKQSFCRNMKTSLSWLIHINQLCFSGNKVQRLEAWCLENMGWQTPGCSFWTRVFHVPELQILWNVFCPKDGALERKKEASWCTSYLGRFSEDQWKCISFTSVLLSGDGRFSQGSIYPLAFQSRSVTQSYNCHCYVVPRIHPSHVVCVVWLQVRKLPWY